MCTLVLFAENTRRDLPRPAVPHDGVLKVGGKVDQASKSQEIGGKKLPAPLLVSILSSHYP